MEPKESILKDLFVFFGFHKAKVGNIIVATCDKGLRGISVPEHKGLSDLSLRGWRNKNRASAEHSQ